MGSAIAITLRDEKMQYITSLEATEWKMKNEKGWEHLMHMRSWSQTEVWWASTELATDWHINEPQYAWDFQLFYFNVWN